MYPDKLIVRGAKEHNLKGIDVAVPRHKLVVITGVYGSLGAVVALLFWIYLGSWMALLGAHISAAPDGGEKEA